VTDAKYETQEKQTLVPASNNGNSDVYVGVFRLPHARTEGVLIVVQRRVKHTDTIFNVVRQNRLHPRESPYYLRDRERITTQYMEEEDHFIQTQLPALIAALAAAAMAARLLPLQPLTFSWFLYCTHNSLLPFALSRMPINRQVLWLLFFNNSSWTWVYTFVNGGCNYHWQMVTLLLRVGCPIMANPNSLYYMPSALFIWGKFNLTKLNQYITLPCNTINHFSSQLFLRQDNLLQNNSAVQANLTCIFMELHPPRRPMMCHDRIVCKIKPHKLRSDFIS